MLDRVARERTHIRKAIRKKRSKRREETGHVHKKGNVVHLRTDQVKRSQGGNQLGLLEDQQRGQCLVKCVKKRVGRDENREVRRGQITLVLVDLCEDLGSESE